MKDLNPINLLTQIVLPIVAIFQGKYTVPMGTGFIVGTFNHAVQNRAVIATAAHVIEWAMKEDRPPPRHHPSALDEFLPKDGSEYTWRDVKLFALITDGTGLVVNAAIDRCWYDRNRDIAFCGISVPASPELQSLLPFNRKIRLKSFGPSVGEEILTAGFPNLSDKSEAFDLIDLPHRVFALEGHVQLNRGKVLERFEDKGPGNQKWPCFQVDCPLPSGMSGGPVLMRHGEEGEELVACGVISSDLQAESGASGEHAFASIIWTSLYIETDLEVLDPETNIGSGRLNILDMIKRSIIEDIDDAGNNASISLDTQNVATGVKWKL